MSQLVKNMEMDGEGEKSREVSEEQPPAEEAKIDVAASVEQTQGGLVAVTERQALVDLYNHCDGANWNNRGNWCTDGTDLNDWFGVTTNEAGQVTQIQLASNNLKGPIPNSIGRFAALEVLDLSRNDISGSLPEGLAGCIALQTLSLRKVRLSGTKAEREATLRRLIPAAKLIRFVD